MAIVERYESIEQTNKIIQENMVHTNKNQEGILTSDNLKIPSHSRLNQYAIDVIS